MNQVLRRLGAALPLLLFAGLAAGQEAPPTRRKIDLDRAIAELADPDWSVREAATSRLLERFDEAAERLEEGMLHPDPEVRLRCRLVLLYPERFAAELIETMAGAPSSEDAAKAYARFRAARLSLVRPLLAKIKAHAARRENTLDMRRIAVAADLLRDTLPAAEATPELITEVAGLLRLNLQGDHRVNTLTPLVIEALATLPRPPILEAIAAILAVDKRSEFRGAQACRALGALGGPEQAPALLAALKHPISATREAAFKALRCLELNDEQLFVASSSIDDDDDDVTLAGIALLDHFGPRSSKGMTRLLPLLKHETDEVRMRAIDALASIRDARAAGELDKVLNPVLTGTEKERADKLAVEAEPRAAAAYALACMGRIPAKEVAALIGPRDEANALLCLALARIPGAEARALLFARAQRTKELVRGSAQKRELARRAVTALGLRLEPEVTAFLIGLSRSGDPDDDLALYALRALRDQNTPAARAGLAEQLGEAKGRRQGWLLRYICERRITEAAPALIALLDKGLASATFDMVTEGLGKIADPKGLEAMRDRIRGIPESGLSTNQQNRRRSLAQGLARAGDLSYMDFLVKEAELGARRGGLGNLGIQLLYAQRWQPAILAFRRQAWSSPGSGSFGAYNIACAEACRGAKESAIRHIYRALAADEDYWYREFRHALTDPDLDSIRDDPRVQRLMEQTRHRGLRGVGANAGSPFSGPP